MSTDPITINVRLEPGDDPARIARAFREVLGRVSERRRQRATDAEQIAPILPEEEKGVRRALVEIFGRCPDEAALENELRYLRKLVKVERPAYALARWCEQLLEELRGDRALDLFFLLDAFHEPWGRTPRRDERHQLALQRIEDLLR